MKNRDFMDIVAQDFNNDEAVNDKYIMKYFKNVKLGEPVREFKAINEF